MADLNNSANLNITPSCKRKRKFKNIEQDNEVDATTSCFTNEAFSSTPNKNVSKRHVKVKKVLENGKLFRNIGLEVKSITEIAGENDAHNKTMKNPFEVLRKPPKKKQRNIEAVTCFENPALNLEISEKVFNPYEILRETVPLKSSNCFSNPALNLKVQDEPTICSPFEVQREVSNDELKNPTFLKPLETSPVIGIQQTVSTAKPFKFKLGIPFVPRVDCRIDFNGLPLSQLTPSKFLSEKIMFSPVSKTKATLDSVEEETTMDIGKELDLYQLELENSINEAKLSKVKMQHEEVALSSPDVIYRTQLVCKEKRLTYIGNRCGAIEGNGNEKLFDETTKQTTQGFFETHVLKEQNVEVKKLLSETNPFRCDLYKQHQNSKTDKMVEPYNLDELYGCPGGEQEDSFDFKTPLPFIRAYTKPDIQKSNSMSKEYIKFDKSTESDDQVKKAMNVKDIIRKSIRKLMHTDHFEQKTNTEIVSDSSGKFDDEKNTGFMNILRQSLRKKPTINLHIDPGTTENEISIIDSTERTLKLKSDLLHTEYVKIEDLTNEKKNYLRNSIRKSTRQIRKQFLNSVFHKKHEEYDCKK